VGKASRDLSEELDDFRNIVKSAHKLLIEEGLEVDGEALLERIWQVRGHSKSRTSGTTGPVTLKRIYTEYLASRKPQVHSNRKTRAYPQISPNTYDKYPFVWDRIETYLTSIKRPNLPLSAITYPFLTKFVEWFTMRFKEDGTQYSSLTIHESVVFLKSLCTYAQSKGYLEHNPVLSFKCRTRFKADPQPLIFQQVEFLEIADLPTNLRHVCDSWLVAAELCLHYSDYKQIRTIKFTTLPSGKRMIRILRTKTGEEQTVNVTERCERILTKWGGPGGLVFFTHQYFCKQFRKIAQLLEIRDEDGEYINLKFGIGRDTGLTQRVLEGASEIQLSKMAGWTSAQYAKHYIGNSQKIIESFIQQQKVANKPSS
jgi:hypothetical protein